MLKVFRMFSRVLYRSQCIRIRAYCSACGASSALSLPTFFPRFESLAGSLALVMYLPACERSAIPVMVNYLNPKVFQSFLMPPDLCFRDHADFRAYCERQVYYKLGDCQC
jgi:hypothetical protein